MLTKPLAHLQWCASTLRRCLSLVPPPALQIDIFITNFKTLEHERVYPTPAAPRPVTPSVPTDYAPVAVEDSDQLLPPVPRFARQRSNSVTSLPSANSSVESFVDMNPVTEHFGDHFDEEQNIGDVEDRENFTLDLTNFEGDDDDALPGEESFSRRVRRQGKIARAKTRKALKAAGGRRVSYARHGRSDSEQSTDTVMGPTRPMSGHFEVDVEHHSDPESSSPRSPQVDRQARPGHVRAPSSLSTMEPLRPGSAMGKDWDAMSGHSLMSQPDTGPEGGLRHEVEDDELTDVNIVSECARPGKPKLERILADEVEHSQGSTIVGCSLVFYFCTVLVFLTPNVFLGCGPSSLNAIVRRAIAFQIDTSRIRRGDMRGSIHLVSEEFAY